MISRLKLHNLQNITIEFEAFMRVIMHSAFNSKIFACIEVDANSRCQHKREESAFCDD